MMIESLCKIFRVAKSPLSVQRKFVPVMALHFGFREGARGPIASFLLDISGNIEE